MNDMRKLMEAVKHLDEDIPAGFKSVVVSMDADDVYANGKPTTAAYIYAYDNSDGDVMSRQKGFGWDSKMDESEYATMVNEVASQVNYYVEEAINEKDDWSFENKKPRYNYIAFSADLGPDKKLNDRFVSDVIANSRLSKMESFQGETYYHREPVTLFKIDRPKKKLGQKIKDLVF